MGAPKTQAEKEELLYRRLGQLHQEVEVMHMALEAILNRRKRQPNSPFPFSLIEQTVRSGLAVIERTVARLVRSIKR